MTKRVLFFVLLSVLFFFLSSFAAAVETGGASWYGGKFQGRRTANGEIFDTNKFTAAHKTLPFNTIVEVTNLVNNKSVLVRINDRGPFVAGRVIDLSRAAAEKIGLVGKGVVQVRLKIITNTAELFTKGDNPVPPGLQPRGKPPLEPVTIQIASFSNRSNADEASKTLKNNNFHPQLEFTKGGYIRILLTDISYSSIEGIKNRLAGLGFQSVLLRKQ